MPDSHPSDPAGEPRPDLEPDELSRLIEAERGLETAAEALAWERNSGSGAPSREACDALTDAAHEMLAALRPAWPCLRWPYA